MVMREFLMPARELRDVTLLSLWTSDKMDLTNTHSLETHTVQHGPWTRKKAEPHTQAGREGKGVPEVLVNPFETGLFPGQSPPSEDGLQVDPTPLDGIQTDQVLI